MKLKNLLIPIVALIALMLIQSALATTNTALMISPSDGAVVQGTITIVGEVNATNYNQQSNPTGTSNISNVTFEFSVDGGTTWFKMGGNTSYGGGNNLTLANWSILFDTTTYADVASGSSDTYRLRINAFNGSVSRVTSSGITVRIDNTLPVVSISSPAAEAKIDGLENTAITISAVNSTYNSSCKVLFSTASGNQGPFTPYTASGSGADQCKYTLTAGTIAEGWYSVKAQATDGYNTTTTATRSYLVDFFKNTGGNANKQIIAQGVQAHQAKADSNNQLLIVLIVAVIGYFFIMKK